MATTGRRSLGPQESDDGFSLQSRNDPNRELFEACRNGDIVKVRKFVNTNNVNAKDTAGRKSSPLHFAAGRLAFDVLDVYITRVILNYAGNTCEACDLVTGSRRWITKGVTKHHTARTATKYMLGF